MKTQVYFGIAWRITVLISIGLFHTFVPEYLHDFFGDEYVEKTSWAGITFCEWEWGARHYWYTTGMVLLFLLSLVNVIMTIVNLVNKNYKFN
jgi:hypothetical protein